SAQPRWTRASPGTRQKPMQRDPNDTCEHCPAFRKHVDVDGKEVLVPVRGADGQPVTKDGAPQFEKGVDGRFLFMGNCCLRAPQVMLVGNNIMTVYPTSKSDWFCEDPDRHAMLERMKWR